MEKKCEVRVGRVLAVFGTRPEAIKMCPLVRTLMARRQLQTTVCVSGQHRQMLDPVLASFGVTPAFDLRVMKPNQTLADITDSGLFCYSGQRLFLLLGGNALQVTDKTQILIHRHIRIQRRKLRQIADPPSCLKRLRLHVLPIYQHAP